MKKIVGIDEAGKGPVIGPMVICGVCCSEDELAELECIGARDSKKLDEKKRVELANKIKKISKICLIKIQPEELDRFMQDKTINEVLTDSYAEIIKKLNPDVAFVDSPDVMPERLSALLSTKTGKDIRAAHKADELYPIVSAASIVAKVERDKEIKKLKELLGDFGSGYASDVKTIQFLRDYFKKHRKHPPFVRKSWKTLSRIAQQSLDEF
jgi:ribonuclease HII